MITLADGVRCTLSMLIWLDIRQLLAGFVVLRLCVMCVCNLMWFMYSLSFVLHNSLKVNAALGQQDLDKIRVHWYCFGRSLDIHELLVESLWLRLSVIL